MVIVVFVIKTDPLLLVLLHQNFIVSTALEKSHFFPGRLSHPSQGSVLGGVQFDNPNGTKHLHRIGIVPVAVDVPLVPVLAVIVIVRPPCNYLPCPRPFLSLVMDSVTCAKNLLEATDRLVQQKKLWLKNLVPWTIDAELVGRTTINQMIKYEREEEIIYKFS